MLDQAFRQIMSKLYILQRTPEFKLDSTVLNRMRRAQRATQSDAHPWYLHQKVPPSPQLLTPQKSNRKLQPPCSTLCFSNRPSHRWHHHSHRRPPQYLLYTVWSDTARQIQGMSQNWITMGGSSRRYACLRRKIRLGGMWSRATRS